MKLTNAVLFLVGIAVCAALPANKNDDVELVRPVKTYGDQPVVDTGLFGGWDNPFSNPFGGLFDNLDGIVERMRQQIASLLNRFPLSRNSTEDIPSFPTGLGASFPALGGIDLSKGNTTSVTKVIDGHTVVINETEYKKEDDFGGAFFKVRIIDVKPDSSELTTEADAEGVSPVTKDREEIDRNSIENEIPKSKEGEIQHLVQQRDNSNQFQNIETFDSDNFDNEISASTNIHEIEFPKSRFSTNQEWSNVKPLVTFGSNGIESIEKEYGWKPADLSRDTYVNEILAQNGAPTNPDAEVFVVDNIHKRSPFDRLIDPR